MKEDGERKEGKEEGMGKGSLRAIYMYLDCRSRSSSANSSSPKLSSSSSPLPSMQSSSDKS